MWPLRVRRLRIAAVGEADERSWDEMWAACPYSTYFHSRAWADVWSDYSEGGLAPAPRLVRFSDGKRALLPLTAELGEGSAVVGHSSSPAGTYGGWLSVDGLGSGHAELLARYLCDSVVHLRWRVNPYQEPALARVPCPARSETTLALSLREGLEAVVGRWSESHRRAVRRARERGVTTRLAVSDGDWEAYDRLYRDSLRRWGPRASSSYEQRLFAGLRSRGGERVKLWLATVDGRIVAGALCLYAGTHAVYWHGAALAADWHLQAPKLLIHDAVADACASGYRWFDLNPSGGHAGVVEFKRRFGPTELPCPFVAT